MGPTCPGFGNPQRVAQSRCHIWKCSGLAWREIRHLTDGETTTQREESICMGQGVIWGHSWKLESRTSLTPDTFSPGPKAALCARSTQCLAVTMLKELLLNKHTQSPPIPKENDLRLWAEVSLRLPVYDLSSDCGRLDKLFSLPCEPPADRSLHQESENLRFRSRICHQQAGLLPEKVASLCNKSGYRGKCRTQSAREAE